MNTDDGVGRLTEPDQTQEVTSSTISDDDIKTIVGDVMTFSTVKKMANTSDETVFDRLNESVEECLEKSPNIDKELDRLADILIKENIVWSKEEEFKTLIEKMDEVAIDVLMKSSVPHLVYFEEILNHFSAKNINKTKLVEVITEAIKRRTK